jgi:hypothetical protein
MSEETTGASQMSVRGISLISIREYVKSRLDGKGLERFFARFPEGEAEIIFTAVKSEWYPFRIQRHLREGIVHEFNPEDPRQAIFDMVEVTANYEISAFLKVILAHLPKRLVLAQIAKLWDKMYRPGKMTLLEGSDNHAVIEVSEFAHDPLFCPTMDAWLTVAARNMDLKNAEVAETACIHRGDERCRWEVRGE